MYFNQGETNMKQLATFAAGMIVGYLVCNYSYAQAIYGPQGQYLGNVQSTGNTAAYYGPQGQYQGMAQSSGNQTNYYGATGNYQGTVQAPLVPPINTNVYIPPSPMQPQSPKGW